MIENDKQILLLVIKARAELPYKMSAFEQLASQVYAGVYNLARAISGSRETAENIAQDVLIRAMHGLPKLEAPEKFPMWLRRITVNTANSWFTKERSEREKRRQFSEQFEWEYEPSTAETSFAQMVQVLGVEERTIVSLKILNEMEFQEISEVTGLSLSAAKMRYYRALEKIRAALST